MWAAPNAMLEMTIAHVVPHRRDPAGGDREATVARRAAESVDELRVADHEVVHRRFSSGEARILRESARASRFTVRFVET